MLETISELEDQLISKNLEPLHITFRLSFQRFTDRDKLVQKLIFGHRDLREKIFIIWNRFSLLIHSYNIISTDIQAKSKSTQQKVNTQSTKRDSDASMPTQFQSLLLPCSASTLSRMLLAPSSWPSKISLSTTETSTLHGVSPMSDALEEVSRPSSPLTYQVQLGVPNLRTKWWDKSLQFQLSGDHHMNRHGLTQHLAV